MANYVIMAVLAVVVLLAARSALRHFRGEGGCCGGGSPSTPTFKTPDATMTKHFMIDIRGMKCENCAAKVQNALNQLEGVSARVSFAEQKAFIQARSMDWVGPCCRAISRAGYKPVVRC